MRIYSNDVIFASSSAQDVSPVFDHDQGETDAKFSGVMVRLVDRRTTVILDVNEVKMVKTFAYLADG